MQGSPFLISLFQHVWSMASVVLKFFSNISSSMQSIHLLFGLSGHLLPGISIFNTCFVTWSCSLCQTCPYHPSLFSCIFLCISVTFILFQISSFLILSHLVTPCAPLNIFISATSILLLCDFLIAHVSVPYVMAGLTTVLNIIPFSLDDGLLLHRTPDNFLQFFQLAWILRSTSASSSLSSASVDPKYLNFFTQFNS